MNICVLGMGYIGLPTAVMFAKKSLKVHGTDINPSLVESLKEKKLHLQEKGLDHMFCEAVDNNNLTFSTRPVNAETFIISVPTPITIDKSADLSYVKEAIKMILPYLQKDNLIVLESTVPPKTIETIVLPILKETKFNIGENLFISYSPERVLPGNILHELVYNDRVIGGINKESAQKAKNLYKEFVKGNMRITDTTTAEAVKLVENTYRDVNIAFANEMARIAEEIGFDVWEVIEMANCHPRVNILNPGPGVGGHCIAVDPWFIAEKAPAEAKLISLSREINDKTPYHVVELIKKAVSENINPTITLLGLTYKGNVSDIRESPSLIIRDELLSMGYKVNCYDPFVNYGGDYQPRTLVEAVNKSDCIVLLTDHTDFETINIHSLSDSMRTKRVIDTKNILKRNEWVENGFEFISIGSKENNHFNKNTINV